MRHRAPRHLSAFLRPHRGRPRRRLAPVASRGDRTTRRRTRWLPARPSTRLASALGAWILIVGGGVFAVGALDDDTVPAVDDPTPGRPFIPSTSRSDDRPTLSSAPDHEATPDARRVPDRETPSDASSRSPSTPSPEASESPPVSLPAPAVSATGETSSLPTPTTPDRSTQAGTATGGHGNGARTVAVDRVAPSTVLDSMPSRRDDFATATFSFHADEPASFTCSLDGGTYRPCGTGVVYRVQPGWHDFAVRATDRAGNVDASPARWHWHTTARR